MSKFEIKRAADGEVVFKGRVTDAAAFRDELLSIRGAGDVELGAYFVGSKPVSFAFALRAAYDALDAAYTKKSETHKLVTYFDGVCGSLASNTARTAWVRK